MLSEFYIPGVLEAAKTLEELDDALLVLRFDLGKLEAAWGRAFAPITARVVPMLDSAVRAVTDFVNAAGQVIAALFGGVQLKAEKTVRVTSSAVKRALADFDQLERLPGGSGSGSYTVPAQMVEIPAQYIAIAEKIKAVWKELTDTLSRIVAPLRAIDFSAACAAFGRLYEAIAPFVKGLFAGLEWAWFNLLTPMAAWATEQALPVFLQTLALALNALDAVIKAVQPMLDWIWNQLLVPMGKWAGENLLAALGALCNWFQTVAGWFRTLSPLTQLLSSGLSALKNGFLRLCESMGLWNSQTGTFGAGLAWLEKLGQDLSAAFALVAQAVSTVHLKLGALLNAMTPLFRGAANGLIGMVNTAISGIQAAINAVVSALNGIELDIPGWVPVVGGKHFGVELDYVSLPRVPALARGAVLPANKPFLAVVGDQKSGTNVEAPLSLIQEALASVLAQDTQDTNRLLASILNAVEGIQVGDETIGRAARRYESRMAVMGGVV